MRTLKEKDIEERQRKVYACIPGKMSPAYWYQSTHSALQLHWHRFVTLHHFMMKDQFKKKRYVHHTPTSIRAHIFKNQIKHFEQFCIILVGKFYCIFYLYSFNEIAVSILTDKYTGWHWIQKCTCVVVELTTACIKQNL